MHSAQQLPEPEHHAMTNYSNHPEPQWDDETWSLALSAMQRLEAAWQSPALPNLADFVPLPRDDPRFAAMLVRLIGTDRDCRCRLNVRKQPADYLAEWPELQGLAQFAAAFNETVDHGVPPAVPAAELLPSPSGRAGSGVRAGAFRLQFPSSLSPSASTALIATIRSRSSTRTRLWK